MDRRLSRDFCETDQYIKMEWQMKRLTQKRKPWPKSMPWRVPGRSIRDKLIQRTARAARMLRPYERPTTGEAPQMGPI